MGRFSRIAIFTPLFLGALLVACSNLSEREAYSVFEEDFAPKPMMCTVRPGKVAVDWNRSSYDSYMAGNGSHPPGELYSAGDTKEAREQAVACMKYLAAAGAVSKLDCKTGSFDNKGCVGLVEASWDGQHATLADDRILKFRCGEWSKAHIESITTRDRDASVSFSRTPNFAGGDALTAAPTECKPSFNEADRKGTVSATRDDSGKWRK